MTTDENVGDLFPEGFGDDVEARARRPATAGRNDLRTRAWILLALHATARNGLTPLSKLRFHRLVYLTNALAPVYSLQASDEQIVKFQRGQFYPNMQWHLDRLMAEGLIKIENVRHFTDDDGAWMDADYRMARPALDVVDEILKLQGMRNLSDFLQEVVKAYASQEDEVLDDLVLTDLTYADMRRARGAVIDFSRSADNLSAMAANRFVLHVRDPRMLSPSDRVHLYIEYMDRIFAGARRRV